MHRSTHLVAGLAAATGLVLACPGAAFADQMIVTDRPDVAESSETVGQWRVQLEIGASVETIDTATGRETVVFTPAKLRFGLLDRWELHLETRGFAYAHREDGVPASSETGFADLDVGTKVHLWEQAGPIPSTGVLLALRLPVGASALTEDAYQLGPTIAADWALTPDWGIGANVGATLPLSNRDEVDDLMRFALVVGRTWAPLSDRLRSYIELFADTALEDGKTALGADGGFCWLVLPNLQLDAFFVVGLTDSAPDFGGGVGISFKL